MCPKGISYIIAQQQCMLSGRRSGISALDRSVADSSTVDCVMPKKNDFPSKAASGLPEKEPGLKKTMKY